MSGGISSRQERTAFLCRSLPWAWDLRSEGENSFSEKPVWARMTIVAAGPLMNILTAFILTVVVIVSTGYATTVIGALDEGYGAQAAGLTAGDRIIRINGKSVHIFQDLQYALLDVGGDPV